MIPKLIGEIGWLDVEELVETRWPESDVIEYKSTFKGGADFLTLTEPQQQKAVEAIAKEVIAFLNGRGGDIIIGIAEEKNESGQAVEITKLHNIDASSERLARSLAARIEPFQSVLNVVPIRANEGDADGVILIRVPSSARAPHRSMKTRECYVRRGKEAVPIPMDEIQDLTINRRLSRNEKEKNLRHVLRETTGRRFGIHLLSAERIHLRICALPLTNLVMELDQEVLDHFKTQDPKLHRDGKSSANTVAFRSLGANWQPVLRGEKLESYCSCESGKLSYVAKQIHLNGMMIADNSNNMGMSNIDPPRTGYYSAWIAGFFANFLTSLAAIAERHPSVLPALVGHQLTNTADSVLVTDDQCGSEQYEFPKAACPIPAMELTEIDQIEKVFEQLQRDIASIAGHRVQPYRLSS